MKRWFPALAGFTLAMAVCAAATALTPMSAGPSVGRAFIGMAVTGLMLCAVLMPRREGDALMAHGRTSDGERSGATFDSVAANEIARRSLLELKDYLRSPGRYADYGARMPRGVLLYGPPGTGKTLLARALAGEAGVPFFALSGSDFVEKYVGVGASRVRELFKKARKAGRCVIFIDEIDAMGKRRDDSASDERDQTLNALLSEMSGFRSGEGIVVIAATNRVEVLDPALLRPGRFDRQIEVALPGRAERLDILRLHSKNKPLDGDVDLEELAMQTVGFSGAALENLLNEAAIIAAGRNMGSIEEGDVQRAFRKVVAGEDRPIAATEAELQVIAVHEAGHALAGHLLMPENRLNRVSILPAGRGAAGYNLTIPPERVMPDQRVLRNQIRVLLAGRAAEAAVFGEERLTSGASSDIARATELAGSMVTELGMAGEPAVSLQALNRVCGGAGDAPERCRRLLDGLWEETVQLMEAHMDALRALSRALMEREAMSGEEVRRVLNGALSSERQESA